MKEKGPQVCVLKTDGINCDEETRHAFAAANAFAAAGGKPKLVHVNELRAREDDLRDYQILTIPGGFSYGDDIASGKILALELTSYLADQINDFINHRGLILGICNGFQVLVRTGLLPFGVMGEMQATLTNNNSGHFECRWVRLKIDDRNTCVFLKDMRGGVVQYQVAHGEGKFFAEPRILENIERESLVVFRYVDKSGNPTQVYTQNPNGSLHAIAGITDPSGRILGLMPHPERFVRREQHPNWRRMPGLEPQGLPIFQKMVTYAAQM